MALIAVALLAVTGKLVLLQGVDGGEYAEAASQARLRTVDIAALRGQVLDRDGNLLAYTVDASLVVADPSLVADPQRTALALTTLLDVPVSELTELLQRDGRYVELAHQVTPETVGTIEELGLAGHPLRGRAGAALPGRLRRRPGRRLRRPGRRRAWPASSSASTSSCPAPTASAGSRSAAAATPSRRASTSPRRPSTAARCS